MKRFLLSILVMLITTLIAYSSINTDLIVVNSEYSPNQIQAQQFSATITLKNIGNVTIDKFNVTNLYFSKDSILSSNDIVGGFVSFKTLQPDSSVTLSVVGGAYQWGINADSSYKYLIINADFQNIISESKESNNIWIGKINIRNANVDLTANINSNDNPDTLKIGDLLNFRIVASNLGSDDINNIWCEYFISADTVFNTSAIKIGYMNYIGFDWTKTGYNESSKSVIPPNLMPGYYYIYVQVDTTGQEISIHDYNLSNNIVRLLKIYVDEKVINNTLNFDEPFGAKTWEEDGQIWSFNRPGGDDIRLYNPHTGSGHASSSPGFSSKLSTTSLFNVQGLWIKTDFTQNFDYLNILGFGDNDSLIYFKELNPYDYDSVYSYLTLNWEKVKSIQFDFKELASVIDTIVIGTDTIYFENELSVELFFDDMDYTIVDENQEPEIITNVFSNTAKSTLKIYPNPSSGIFNLAFGDELNNFSLKVIDGFGRTIFVQKNLSGKNCSFDISGFSKGIYFVEINQNSNIRRVKMLKN